MSRYGCSITGASLQVAMAFKSHPSCSDLDDLGHLPDLPGNIPKLVEMQGVWKALLAWKTSINLKCWILMIYDDFASMDHSTFFGAALFSSVFSDLFALPVNAFNYSRDLSSFNILNFPNYCFSGRKPRCFQPSRDLYSIVPF